MAVFLTEGFFTGVNESFFALGLPGAVFFWRVEDALLVVFVGGVDVFFALGVVLFPEIFVELFAFAFGVVEVFFFGGIILQCHGLQVVRGQVPDKVRDYFQHLQG